MPIIPRYQPRGGPRLQGLDYAGAYQPPGGDDWRMFGRAMQTFAPLAQATYNRIQEAKSRGGGGGDSQAEPEPAPDQSAALEGVGGEVAWRDHMNSMGDRLDPHAVATSREQFGAGLSEAGRQVFDLATRPREQGFISQARYSGEQAAQARWETLAQRREQLGVEEYARLVDIDPEAGRAALGSAIAQRAQRMMAAGASAEETQAARRTLVVDAEMARLGHALRDSPERAEALLAQTGRLLPEAEQARAAEAIGAERLRREAQQTVESLAAELDDAVGNFDALELAARAAAGADPVRQGAFSGAATGFWRRAKADLEAREHAALAQLAGRMKAGGDIASWTDLPTEAWQALSSRQQAMVRGHLQAPWRDSDPVATGLLKDMAARQPGAFKDFDLMSLGDRLSLDDLQDWRTLQQDARSGEPGWRRRQAVLAGMARAIDRADGVGGDPAFRGAAYAAFEQAQTLKGGDLSPQELADACLQAQDDWLTGGASDQDFFDAVGDLIQPWRKEERRREAEEEARLVQQEKIAREALAYRLREPRVEEDYIKRWENGFDRKTGVIDPYKTKGYVPTNGSGVTIGTGVDLGQKTVGELKTFNLDPVLLAKLTPYAAAGPGRPTTGAEAKRRLAAKPLVLTPAEAEQVTKASHRFEMSNLLPAYNSASKIGRFQDLPIEAQTVIFSLYLQHGTSDPRRTAPKFWLAVTTGDWAAAENELRYGFPGDLPTDRRPADADKVRAAITAGRLKLKPGTALKPLPPPKPNAPGRQTPRPGPKPAAKPARKPAPKAAPKTRSLPKP